MKKKENVIQIDSSGRVFEEMILQLKNQEEKKVKDVLTALKNYIQLEIF